MATAWRLAKSLETLRSEINSAYPNRSKASDGGIGDTAHANTASDHNPNPQGVVCAFDFTHDPAHGFDAHATANKLIVTRNPNLKYVISNSRIAGAWTNWRWTHYAGSNPHSKHIHVSVGVGSDGRSQPPYDGTQPWNIKGGNEVIIGKEDNWYGRFNRFHHQLVRNGNLPRSVFNSIIGQDAWKILESWSDHPEANQLLADQVLGELARKDGWQNQIYAGLAKATTLEKERNLARDTVTAKQIELDAALLAVSQAKAELALKGDDTKNLNALGLLLQWAVKRLGLK